MISPSTRTVRAPMVLLAWALGSVALQRLRPLSIHLGEVGSLLATAGLVVGLGLWMWALVELGRHGTSLDPGRPATALVMSGPYGFSRNPAYLGLVSAMTGLALFREVIWGVFLVPMAAVILDRWTIPAEEADLGRAFGEGFVNYEKTVRRWFGRNGGVPR